MADFGDTIDVLWVDTADGLIGGRLGDSNTAGKVADAISTAEDLGETLIGLHESLETQATTAAATAETAITQALKFKPKFSAVRSATPSFNPPAFKQGVYGNAPEAEGYVVPDAIVPYTVTPVDKEFIEGDTSAPTSTSVTIEPISPLQSNSGFPVELGKQKIDINTAPIADFFVTDLPVVPKVSSMEDIEAKLELLPFLPPKFDLIDTKEIERAATSLRTALELSSITLPDYEYCIGDVFSIVGKFTDVSRQDGGVLLNDILLEGTEEVFNTNRISVASIWSKRGFSGVPDTSEYIDVVGVRYRDRINRSEYIALERWKADAYTAGLEMAVAAYSMLIDIESAVYDQRFMADMQFAEAELERAKATVYIYNANVAIYTAEAEVYNSELAKLSADVSEYKSQMQLEELKGRVNTLRVDAFTAEERAKSSEVQVYAANVKAQEAKVQAYAANLRGLAADVMCQEVAVEVYKSTVVEWEAKMKRTGTEYAVYSSKVKGLVAQMRGEAVKQSVTVANNKTVEAKVQIGAAKVGVKAAQIKMDLTYKMADHASVMEQNSAKSAGYNTLAAEYAGQVAEWSIDYKQRTPAFEGTQLYVTTAQEYMRRATESYARAAKLTQQVETDTATAQMQLAETAGKAGAAIEQGRLAGFRASISASAGAGVSGGYNYSHSFANSTSSNFSYNSSANESISA